MRTHLILQGNHFIQDLNPRATTMQLHYLQLQVTLREQSCNSYLRI
jgi:hypothetical protein